jgi:hypothetical protein
MTERDGTELVQAPVSEDPELRAACGYCGQPMDDGVPCTWMPEVAVEGERLARLPYGPPPAIDAERYGSERAAAEARALWATWPEGWPANCHDCAAPQGALHHPGCDAEACPRCLHQAISCGCQWEQEADQAAEPDNAAV